MKMALRATRPEPAGEAEIAEHERLPPRQLRPEAHRLAARDPKADRRRDVTIVEAADAALPTPPSPLSGTEHSGEAMPRGGGLAEFEVAAHHKFLSSHEQADRPPAGTHDAARRKPSVCREVRHTNFVFVRSEVAARRQRSRRRDRCEPASIWRDGCLPTCERSGACARPSFEAR